MPVTQIGASALTPRAARNCWTCLCDRGLALQHLGSPWRSDDGGKVRLGLALGFHHPEESVRWMLGDPGHDPEDIPTVVKCDRLSVRKATEPNCCLMSYGARQLVRGRQRPSSIRARGQKAWSVLSAATIMRTDPEQSPMREASKFPVWEGARDYAARPAAMAWSASGLR